ncbi:MAG: A/G-specific adenine glycosylase [Bacteroidota bacterium]
MNFGGLIRGWYKKNRRDLPWRHTRDPYRIWLSEVILQQTRVSQGLEYYNRFIATYPDVVSLAEAGEDEVLKLWQGLGYYSRARNLHSAAKELVAHRNGRFPDNYKALLGLRGVGVYTASAISSICFKERRAVVDGNVSRVIARLFGVDEAINAAEGSRIVYSLAEQMLERDLPESGDPGIHNQAIMEFGALQCVPISPRCEVCPLSDGCQAYLSGRVDTLPVKIPKKRPTKRWFYFYILHGDGPHGDRRTIITRRGGNDIWKGLYQFPMLETNGPKDDLEITGGMLQQLFEPSLISSGPANARSRAAGNRACGLSGANPPAEFRITMERISPLIRHQLTHRTIQARFIHLKLSHLPSPMPDGWIAVPFAELDNYPLPRLIDRYIKDAGRG